MAFFAKDDKISTSPLAGGVEITEAQYNAALSAKLDGKKTDVREGELWIASATMREVYSTDDGAALEIPDNDDTPEGYTIASRPSVHHTWDGSAWVRDDAEYLAAKKSEYEVAVERHLDAVAKAHGYNTIYTALSYRGSSNAKFAAEAQAMSDWRDAVWLHVFAMYESIEEDFQDTGVLTIPELQTVLDGLPEYTFEYVEAVE